MGSEPTSIVHAHESLLNSPILIVDDDARIVQLLRTVLERAGYRQVLTTSDPVAVVPLLRSQPIDLLILDLSMPVVSGMDILEDLRELVTRDEFFPVLVLTADPRPETRLQALLWGARCVLTKPVDAAEALLQIRSLLETRTLFQRLSRSRTDPGR